MCQHGGFLGFLGFKVLCHTHIERYFRTVAVFHLHLDGSEGTVVAHDVVVAWGEAVLLRPALHAVRLLIGTVDEAVVGIAVAPRVADNPGTDLVVAVSVLGFADDSVAVEVELHAVVVAHNRHSVVVGLIPVGDIFHPRHSDSIVGSSFGDIALEGSSGHTDTADAARGIAVIAAAVP